MIIKVNRRWPMKMSKMILGQNAENDNWTLTPNCRNHFRELGQNVENYVCSTLRYLLGNLLTKIKMYIDYINSLSSW